MTSHKTCDKFRVREQPRLVSNFYNAETSFYEFGWSSNFHFAPRHQGENLQRSILRHLDGVGKLLRLGPNMRVADIGCGVGGPLVNIAKATGAKIVGINFNVAHTWYNERDGAIPARFYTQT